MFLRPVVLLCLWRGPLCRGAHHPRSCQESWIQSWSGDSFLRWKQGELSFEQRHNRWRSATILPHGIKELVSQKVLPIITCRLCLEHITSASNLTSVAEKKHLIDISMCSGSQRRPQNGGTVMGTIDDLSDDEKTRAFLQLLEYKLRMEKEQVC